MTTQTINPTASAHDVREAAGTVVLTSNVLTAGTHWVGLFLPSVAVPVGATINSATLYYKSVDAARDDPHVVWYANDVDDAAVFTTGASNVSSRTLTTASVTDSATGIGTTNYRAVNITSLIAEVTARGGWAAGNDIALIGDCQGGIALEYGHYDGGANVWYAEINYTSGTSGAGAATLGSVTGTAAAVLPLKAAAASTLGAIAATGTAALGVNGTASSTLGAVTGAASSTLATHGEGAATLGAVSGTAAGALAI